MIILSDGTEWHFEDLERLNKIKVEKDWSDRHLDREKVHEVGKPLNNK